MNGTPFDTRASEWEGDMAAWLQKNASDNREQLERLRRNLRLARLQELTPRQQELLTLYYEEEMTIPEIAQHLEINRSTVSRTLRRARERLHHYLQYAF